MKTGYAMDSNWMRAWDSIRDLRIRQWIFGKAFQPAQIKEMSAKQGEVS